MKKKLYVFLAILFSIAVLSACGNSSSNENNDSSTENNVSAEGDFDGKTLRVSAQSWIIDKWPLKEAAEKFMNDHPGSKVEIQPAVDKGTGDQYLLQWSSGKSDSDLSLGGSPADIAVYVAKDLLVEFDDEFFDDITKDDYIAPFLESGVFNGTQYSIPLLGEVISLNVRKDLMDEAGLLDEDGNPIPPESWDELYDYAKELSKSDGGENVYGISIDLGTNFVYQNYYSGLMASKGEFLDENNLVDFSSDESEELLEFWKSVTEDGYAQKNTLQDQNAGRDAFKTGGVAMLWTAASRTQEFIENFGEENVATMPLPNAEENGSFAFTHGIYIPKAGQEEAMAKAFIKEQLLEIDNQQATATEFGKLPVLKDNFEGLSEDLSSLLPIIEESKGEPLYKEQAKLTDLIHLQISNMLVNGQSVDDTMNNINDGMQNLDLETE